MGCEFTFLSAGIAEKWLNWAKGCTNTALGTERCIEIGVRIASASRSNHSFTLSRDVIAKSFSIADVRFVIDRGFGSTALYLTSTCLHAIGEGIGHKMRTIYGQLGNAIQSLKETYVTVCRRNLVTISQQSQGLFPASAQASTPEVQL